MKDRGRPGTIRNVEYGCGGSRDLRISVIQMSPGSVKSDNIAQARRLIQDCIASDHPDLIVLPEVWNCLGGDRETRLAAAEAVPAIGSNEAGGDAFEFLRQTAATHGIHVHGGSIGERYGDRLLNTSLVIDPSGRLVARYSKIHLFDIVTPGGIGYRESDLYRGGSDVVTVALTGPFGSLRVGLAICYDLRFGELFHRLRLDGAELVVLPAAFTAETGEAHWETLLRARAIETQSWFAAAGTVGTHHDGTGRPQQTYGHSMVIDPWGVVTARTSSGPGWATGRLDQDRTRRIRANMPVMDHRRLV